VACIALVAASVCSGLLQVVVEERLLAVLRLAHLEDLAVRPQVQRLVVLVDIVEVYGSDKVENSCES
jgi:hypothetical protein